MLLRLAKGTIWQYLLRTPAQIKACQDVLISLESCWSCWSAQEWCVTKHQGELYTLSSMPSLFVARHYFKPRCSSKRTQPICQISTFSVILVLVFRLMLHKWAHPESGSLESVQWCFQEEASPVHDWLS
jgi:hypothetical protein